MSECGLQPWFIWVNYIGLFLWSLCFCWFWLSWLFYLLYWLVSFVGHCLINRAVIILHILFIFLGLLLARATYLLVANLFFCSLLFFFGLTATSLICFLPPFRAEGQWWRCWWLGGGVPLLFRVLWSLGKRGYSLKVMCVCVGDLRCLILILVDHFPLCASSCPPVSLSSWSGSPFPRMNVFFSDFLRF